MTTLTHRGFSINLPDIWIVRDRDGFGSLFTDLASQPGVDRDLVAMLGAEVHPVIDAATKEGLVLLGGFVESIEPVPADPTLPDEVPFDQGDIDLAGIAAGVAIFEQQRPSGSIAELRRHLDGLPGRWITSPQLIELPCGPAVVTREVQAVQPPSLKRPSDVLLITYYVFPEVAPDVFLACMFRTPSLGFATEFDEQFAAIATTLEAIPREQTQVGADGG